MQKRGPLAWKPNVIHPLINAEQFRGLAVWLLQRATGLNAARLKRLVDGDAALLEAVHAKDIGRMCRIFYDRAVTASADGLMMKSQPPLPPRKRKPR